MYVHKFIIQIVYHYLMRVKPSSLRVCQLMSPLTTDSWVCGHLIDGLLIGGLLIRGLSSPPTLESAVSSGD